MCALGPAPMMLAIGSVVYISYATFVDWLSESPRVRQARAGKRMVVATEPGSGDNEVLAGRRAAVQTITSPDLAVVVSDAAKVFGTNAGCQAPWTSPMVYAVRDVRWPVGTGASSAPLGRTARGRPPSSSRSRG